ncbi:MAG: ABC transporter permease [Desulfobacterales bacterium]|nr:ABC transporter permease [Desulfobacterales bacterium]
MKSVCIEKKSHTRQTWGSTLAVSTLPALVIGAVIFQAAGVSSFRAYAVMLEGAFGNWYAFSEVLVKAIPLMFTGIAVALAARMALWNIGCEGQLVFGGIFAAGVALFFHDCIPDSLMIPILCSAGFAGGALWALIPALMKACWNVNEIISTLMFNYIAVIIMEHLYFGPWRDPMGRGFPGTAMLDPTAWLPRFFQTRIHLGLLIALAAAAAVYVSLSRLTWGYRINVIGKSPKAAGYAHIKFTRQTIVVLLISGGLAGLAGMSEVCGIHLRLQQGVAVGYGYDGIIIAFLARLNPLAVPVIAVFLGGLIVGGDQLQSALHLPSSISQILEGTMLMAIAAGNFFAAYRIKWLRSNP